MTATDIAGAESLFLAITLPLGRDFFTGVFALGLRAADVVAFL